MDVHSLFDLTGKGALITGGSGVLGSSVAKAFAEAGARVVIADINQKAIDEVVNAITAKGGQAWGFLADMSQESEIEGLFRDIDAIMDIDILVNAVAAPFQRFHPESMPLEDWNHALTYDLTSFFLCSRAAAQRMIKRGSGGSIVNFSSIAGTSSLGRGGLAYGVAKSGVSGLTRELAFEWAQYNIRVNAILPAQFINNGWKAMIEDPERAALVARVISGIPLGRMGNPEEIVGPALFLASDAASMVTGVLLPVDGGNGAMNPGGSLDW